MIQMEKKNVIWIRQAVIVAILDVISIASAYFVALLMRFDFQFAAIPKEYLAGYTNNIIFRIVFALIIFYCFNLYRSIWRFASISELQRIIAAYLVLIIVYSVGMSVLQFHMPRSCYIIGVLLSFLCTVGLRFSYRFIQTFNFRNFSDNFKAKEKENIMVIGGGQSGKTIIRELIASSHLNNHVCCIIDDNPNKKGRLLEGIPIVGNRYLISEMVKKHKINKIIYAIPDAKGEEKKSILQICQDTKCEVQVIPSIYQLINGEISVSKLHRVEIQDLLGRNQIKVNSEEIYHYVEGKTILITGGGGSIGSELCRQIANSRPKLLIIFDIYENNAYQIRNELLHKHKTLKLEVFIGSVRDTNRMNSIIEKYCPDIIYHAAAHKHVPLMEDSPNEAIKNNVLGTYKLATVASKLGVKKFVLISTDKAVNPTNIMGASKRLCEMIIQMMNRQTKTEFVAVRFGNVLGSNGSVVPLFKEQIKAGGPVTVTDPNITRYFMIIPEAVSLVLQASYYAKGGEIFVLNMGSPIKIDDMARNLIRLSGYVPDVDIKIEYTGLRPGEKLYEELLMDEEGLQNTENKLIHIGRPIKMDDIKFKEQLDMLANACKNETVDIRSIIVKMVPTYKRNG